ncbi:alpha/beta-hydrolase [Basidiobolus meristosporus CBS 931.73]|uniref:sn-1-specific diacylglycerol lipase n=1 Tax=Basidiobolus meristosporus CBS 931.73 TaxID=1314790 RepID=A0A1Y1X2T6_9FUNG|nr:alpha/beta-hydrolase [Basidiobolus meristosporus CBS 931.73]ORY07868.1 alpha/beta-hydrolase [Basidiobolus meristosporus CBS 931.73]|eukprot:ORX80120.1 alpha/beta-hydrolase [Basidiobolus meristosporus CBS 931.73]
MIEEFVDTQFPSTYYNPITPTTLLNPEVASLITTVSTATRISLRLASIITEAIFESLKYSTATSMDLSKRALISAISAAKTLHSSKLLGSNEIRDSISQAYYKALDGYTSLGIYLINNTFSLAELFIHTGFHLTSKTVKTGISAAEESVRIIDGLFGSTDTSRALAAIVALVKREVYEDEDFHLAKLGNIVVLRAITKAMVAFACLQSVTHIRSSSTVRLVLMYENTVSVEGQALTRTRKRNCTGHGWPRKSSGKELKLESATSTYIAQETTVRDFSWEYDSTVSMEQNRSTSHESLDSGENTANFNPQSKTNKGHAEENDLKRSSSFYKVFQTINHRVTHRKSITFNGESKSNDDPVGHESRPDPHNLADPETNRQILSYSCDCGKEHADSNSAGGFAIQNFPQRPLIRNVSRFIRYASASYGKNFMKILGIGVLDDILHQDSKYHPNHYAFAKHTSLPLESILLSSFTNVSSLSSHRLHNLVHYVAVDHSINAIVLTCRGTLGLSDVLTDLTCDYAEMHVWGKRHLAHAGMLQSARILASVRSEVHRTILQALIDHPNYGLVLCGHSLGGGVAALLSILWSVKVPSHSLIEENCFVTSSGSGLPPGRVVHCFTYGSPCVVSLNLSKECSGLVTSIVNHYDIVPCLSLGLLKDFKNVAMSLYEEGQIADQIISSVLGIHTGDSIYSNISRKNSDPLAGDPDRDWFWSLIKTMRADMSSEKLYPPGVLYLLDTKPTLDVGPSQPAIPATRVTMHRCENVEDRFSEILFSKSMLLDHSPRSYEDTIALLVRGLGELNTDPTEILR